MKAVTKHELRCVCSRRPLLGVYGIDSKGGPYIHIKAWKQNRLITEIVAHGDCTIRCRECLRWFRFRFPPHSRKPERMEVASGETLGTVEKDSLR